LQNNERAQRASRVSRLGDTVKLRERPPHSRTPSGSPTRRPWPG